MQFISADYIFDGYHFLNSNEVIGVSEDGTIQGIFNKDISEKINHYKGLLMPGLINAHCHLELSHLYKAIPTQTGLVDFLILINKTRNTRTKEAIEQAIEVAELNMIQNGIVAVGDISNTLDSLTQKNKKNIHYHTFVECVGLLSENATQRFEFSKKIFEEFEKNHNSSLVLHAPYSVSQALIELVNIHQSEGISSLHNQECIAENELFQTGNGDFNKLFQFILNDDFKFPKSGKNSLESLITNYSSTIRLMLVHNTFSEQKDIEFANKYNGNLSWCVCPNANLYIENKLPNLPLWIAENCHIVIGTDSLASNHILSIFEEIKTIQKHFPNIALENILQWATSNGAVALNIGDKFGSFEKGKKPGILNIENFINKNIFPEQAIISRLFAQ